MLTERLLDGILRKLPGQTFTIKRVRKMWTQEEEARFERELEYLTEQHPLERIVDGYVFLTETTMEEGRYFQERGGYRYHSFEEVDKRVYADREKMTLCMLGLSVAEYLWETILLIHRFYEKTIRKVCGGSYLEIGPGHGKYFPEAYNLGKFQKYVAVDVSKTAIGMTDAYMKRYAVPGGYYELLCRDATELDTREKYDFIVAQEVLEHLEDPLGMLRKIGSLLSENGQAYVLMPIMAPSKQHIFLFRDVQHVKQMVKQAGLEIVEEAYITAKGMPVEEAEKKRLPVNACLIVKNSH